MPPAFRASRHSGSIIIKRADVKSIKTVPRISIETTSDVLNFGYSDTRQAEMIASLVDDSRPVEKSIPQSSAEIDSAARSPQLIIENVLSGGPLAVAQLENLITDAEYSKRLFVIISKLKKPKRLLVFYSFALGGPNLRNACISRLSKIAKRKIKGIAFVLSIILVGGLLLMKEPTYEFLIHGT